MSALQEHAWARSVLLMVSDIAIGQTTMPLPRSPRVAPLTPGSGRLTWLPALGIRGQLLAGFIAVALFTGGLGAYALAAMALVDDNQNQMYTDEFGGLDVFTQYIQETSQVRLKGLAYLLATTQAQHELLRQQVADGEATIKALVTELDATDVDRSDTAALAAMTDAWNAYTQWRDNVLFGPIGESDPAATSVAASTDGTRLLNNFANAADAFRAQRRTAAAELAASGAAAYEQTRRIAIGLSLGAVVLALGIGFFVSRSILRAVRQVRSAAGKLALGELDQELELRSHDELGQMAEAFRSMVSYQKEMATVATAIAAGDLSMDIEPKSPSDVLGNAFQRMSATFAPWLANWRIRRPGSAHRLNYWTWQTMQSLSTILTLALSASGTAGLKRCIAGPRRRQLARSATSC